MKETIDKYKRQVWFKVVICIVAYIICPFTFVWFAVPLLLIRVLAMLTAPLFRPNLKKILSCESGMMTLDNIYTEPKHAVVGMHYTDKPISEDVVMKTMSALIKSDKFPELKQRLERWFGLYFWADCPTFSLSNHVTTCNDVRTLRDVQIKHNSLCRKPFLRDSPLWELNLFPNYRDKEGGSAFSLRVHHCLTDGVGHVNLLSGIGGKDPPVQPIIPLHLIIWSWITHLALIFKLFLFQYDLAIAFLVDYDVNAWIRPREERSNETSFYESSNELELITIKKAAKAKGATFSEVLMAAYATAIREDMEAAGEKVPLAMSAVYALPKQGHPGTLTNHAYLSTLVLPVGVRSLSQQLEELKTDFALKRWGAPLFNTSVSLAGIFLQLIRKLPKSGTMTTVAITNFALSSKPWNLFGAEVKKTNFAYDMAEHVPIVSMFIGYREHMNIWLKGRADVWQSEERPKRIANAIIRCVKEMAKEI